MTPSADRLTGVSASGSSLSTFDFKLLLIGNSSAGKSSLLLRLHSDWWIPEGISHDGATVGVDFKAVKMEVGQKHVNLNVWDTAGQECYRSITSSYYRGAQGVFLVYDISDRKSFEALPDWFAELHQRISGPVATIIVGNKLDKELTRQVPTSEGTAFARSMDALFIEASAKTTVGVQEAFEKVVQRILDTAALSGPEVAEPPATGAEVHLTEKAQSNGGGRCC